MTNFNDIRNWYRNISLEKVSENLKKRDFNTVILNSKDEIIDYILGIIPVEASVGIGGSVTIRETGIDARLKERGNRIYDHWDTGLDKNQVLEIRKKQLLSDFFLTGLNAVTQDGRIVNIDGIGNRVSAMIFGPGHVIAVAGVNKIVRDVHDAVRRIKNITSPQNSKRLGLNTPCAKTGQCADCKADKSVCRVTTIINYRPGATDFTVILTPLELGF